MSEPTSAGDEMERADRAHRLGVDMKALLEQVEPLRADESFEISDLSDCEWAEFVLAVHR
jgi:hypothetical protein